jgi:hypothetical protein
MPKFEFSGFCLLVGLVTFAIQQGCSLTGTAPSWIWGTVCFLLAILLVVLAIWFWDQTASHHWLRKSVLTIIALALMGLFSYMPISKQYRREHNVTPNLLAALLRSETAQRAPQVASVTSPKPVTAEQLNSAITELKAEIRRLAEKPGSAPSQTVDLKKRALALSSDILSFLMERKRGEPILAGRDNWDAVVRYGNDTGALCVQKFGVSSIAIRDELSQHGLHDGLLDDMLRYQTHNSMIYEEIAKRIGVLAQGLPNSR